MIYETIDEITHLYMADSNVTLLPAQFGNCHNLVLVDLSGNALTEQASATIATIMKNNRSLTSLKSAFSLSF